MAVRRIALWALALVLLLIGGLVVLGVVASRSETVLRWSIERFASRLPCQLVLEGLRGAIIEPLHIARVSCENDDYRVEAQDVLLDWSPWALSKRRLDITTLRIASLAYSEKRASTAPTKSGPPENLRVPLQVRAGMIEIGNSRIERDKAAPLQLNGLRATYEGDARGHRLALQSLSSEWGNVQGEGTLGAAPPFSLQARLKIDSKFVDQWPIDALVQVTGPLARVDVSAEGRAGALPFSFVAELAPFEAEPVKALRARSDAVDLAAIDQRLPATALAVDLSAHARGFESLSGTLSVLNSEPGPVDAQRLPLKELQAQFQLSPQGLELQDARFNLGAAGEGSGQVAYRHGVVQLEVEVRRLDLRGLYSTLRETHLSGSLRVEGGAAQQRVTANLREAQLRMEGEALVGDGRVRIERLLARRGNAQVSATGAIELDESLGYSVKGELRRFNPAQFGDFPEADLNGTVQAQGVLRPQWIARVAYRFARSRYLGQPVSGNGKLTIAPDRVREVDARLRLGANSLMLRGSFGVAGDAMRFDLSAPDLAAFKQGIVGSLRGEGTLSGTASRPALDGRFSAARMAYEDIRVATSTAELQLAQGEDPRVSVRVKLMGLKRGKQSLDRLNISAQGLLSAHRIELSAQGERVDATAELEGAFRRADATWRGRLLHADNAGEYAFALLQPAVLELGADRVLFGATRARLFGTDVDLGETVYRNGELASSGSVSGVPLARLLALMKQPPKLDSTLVFGARWTVKAGERLDATLDVVRESGDLVMQGEEPLALGLRQGVLSVRAVANRIDAELAISGDSLEVQASAQTTAQRRAAGWGLAGDAPLKLDARAELKSIRALIALVAGDMLVGDGSVLLSVQAAGTVAKPGLVGKLAGDDLKFEQVANGVFLRKGTLRAQFGEEGLSISEFSIRGGEGTFSAKGRLATREGTPKVDLNWSAQKLAIVQHPDVRLTVSGAGTLQADERKIALAGALTADRGRIELRSRTAPALGSDVVVVGREERASMTERAMRSELDLKLGLGPDFRLSGRGIEARLAGDLKLTSPGDAPLSAKGEIRVAEGEYAAYGQQLSIDEGVFYFSGPVDNPGLLIRAMRKKQPVEAGVEITGTARDPQVRLVSSPEVPDPEKLSWLVLGRAVDSGSAQDTQALQASAVALAAGLGTSPLQQQLAGAVGLDELRVGVSSDGTQGGVIAVGKRISDRIYVSNERSLSTAANTLRITYQLSKRWSLRTESGDTDAVDLFFTISFD